MVARTQYLSSFLITLTLLFFAGSAAAEDVSSSCEAAIDRAAGNYSRCLLGAQSRNARRPNASRLERASQRCADRFDRARDRALAGAERRDKTCTPFLEEIADRTVSYADAVATEASGTPASSILYVQNGTSGTLSETTLTLTRVSSETVWFSDRPDRVAGRVTTEWFVSAWDEGENSFADNPPNADFTCEVDDGVVNYVVELTSPSLAGGDLSYLVNPVGDTVLPQALQCEFNSHLFIDSDTQSAPGSDSDFCSGDTNKPSGCPCTDDSQCGVGGECRGGWWPPGVWVVGCHSPTDP